MTDNVTGPLDAEHDQVLGFARILTTADVLVTAADALDYLADPHAFDREHDLWTRSGRPQPPCADDLAAADMLGERSPQALALRQRHRAAGAAWDAFCDLLDNFDRTGRPMRLTAGRTRIEHPIR